MDWVLSGYWEGGGEDALSLGQINELLGYEKGKKNNKSLKIRKKKKWKKEG